MIAGRAEMSAAGYDAERGARMRWRPWPRCEGDASFAVAIATVVANVRGTSSTQRGDPVDPDPGQGGAAAFRLGRAAGCEQSCGGESQHRGDRGVLPNRHHLERLSIAASRTVRAHAYWLLELRMGSNGRHSWRSDQRLVWNLFLNEC